MAGKRHARYRYHLYSAASEDAAYEAQQRGETAQVERAGIAGRLGTESQVAGTGDFASDPRLGNYAARYTMSPYSAQVAGGKFGPGSDAMQTGMTEANSFLEQAEAAARNGQWDVAEQFRSQADARIAGFGVHQEFFNLERDPIAGANATLSSPTARLVGADVQRAGQLSDPNSPAYRQLYTSMTEPGAAEIEAGYTKGARTIAQGLAGTQREGRDMAAGRGAGRNALGEMNLMARINESANTELANMRLDADIAKGRLFADATKFMITYGDEFRRNTVQYSQDWINGAPYVRDGYVNAQTQMAQFSSTLFAQRAAGEAAYAAGQEARSDARAAYYRNLIIAAGTVVATMGLGAIAAGAVAGGMTAAEGAVLGGQLGGAAVGGGGGINLAFGGRSGGRSTSGNTQGPISDRSIDGYDTPQPQPRGYARNPAVT